MSAKTKIMVFHMKELIYTGIFILLGILFLILLLFMFLPGKKKDSPTVQETMALYVPGVYTTSITLNDMAFDVEVVVDSSHINSMRLINLDEAVTTMFPLIEPSFEHLSEQICLQQSLDDLTYDQDSKYTSQTLIHAIETTLLKAQAPLDENE